MKQNRINAKYRQKYTDDFLSFMSSDNLRKVYMKELLEILNLCNDRRHYKYLKNKIANRLSE